jgi:hypothetical protein
VRDHLQLGVLGLQAGLADEQSGIHVLVFSWFGATRRGGALS